MCGLPMLDAALRLVQEALDHLGVGRHVAAQDLDRDALVDDLVAPAVDDAHAAFAEELLDDVATVERLAEVGSTRCCDGRPTVFGTVRPSDAVDRCARGPSASGRGAASVT